MIANGVNMTSDLNLNKWVMGPQFDFPVDRIPKFLWQPQCHSSQRKMKQGEVRVKREAINSNLKIFQK